MLEQQLYESLPDRLYTAPSGEIWYACYDNSFCILTNAGGQLESFCYTNKSEYRDVRRQIVNEYRLREVRIDNYDEDYR